MDEDRDQPDADAATVSSRIPGTNLTWDNLAYARRVAEDGWRVMDTIDQTTLDRIEEAERHSTPVHRTLALLDEVYQEPQSDLARMLEEVGARTTRAAEELERFAGIPHHEAAERAAYFLERNGLLEDHPRSALDRMIEESTSYVSRLVAEEGHISALERTMNEASGYQSLADRLAQDEDARTGFLDLLEQRGTTDWVLNQLGNQSTTDWVLAHLDKAPDLSMIERLQAEGATSLVQRLSDPDFEESVLGSLSAAVRHPERLEGLWSSFHDPDALGNLRSLTEHMTVSDLAGIAQQALGGVPFSTVQSVIQHLEEAGVEDANDFDVFAASVMPEVEAPETTDPEDLTATEAFVRLLELLRPDLSQDPEEHRRIRRYAGGGGVLMYAYIHQFHPALYDSLAVLLNLLAAYSVMLVLTDHAVARGKSPKDKD